MNNNIYDESYFEGKNSNYWWTVGSYEKLGNYPHWEEILESIRGFEEDGKLLDIGCAYGFLVRTASRYFESYGIDISCFATKMSKRFCGGDISRASATNLPFMDESFDVVTVVDTLEHIPHLNLCLKDIARILRKEGVLFLQLPNPLIWKHLCGSLGLEDETHMNNFWLKQWKTILTNYGFNIEKCFGMVTFAFKKIRFFVKSGKAISLFPELWIIARK